MGAWVSSEVWLWPPLSAAHSRQLPNSGNVNTVRQPTVFVDVGTVRHVKSRRVVRGAPRDTSMSRVSCILPWDVRTTGTRLLLLQVVHGCHIGTYRQPNRTNLIFFKYWIFSTFELIKVQKMYLINVNLALFLSDLTRLSWCRHASWQTVMPDRSRWLKCWWVVLTACLINSSL